MKENTVVDADAPSRTNSGFVPRFCMTKPERFPKVLAAIAVAADAIDGVET